MCGRTGLSLNRDGVRCACAYKPRHRSVYEKPEWSDEFNGGKVYAPSSNIAPTDVTPVIVSLDSSQQSETRRILKPMLWGMIPPWHKGEYNKHGLSTNNCRIENVLRSKLYGAALRGGHRCIVLAEGFYEWQTTDKMAKSKQPYFVYAPQDDSVKIDDSTTWKNEYDEVTGWKGVKLLKMAGLYNRWEGGAGPVYSYSIITLESNSALSWLHHRMPAVLDNDEIAEKWLDTKNVNEKEAVSLLKPSDTLRWHPVSTQVNNSRNKSTDCNKRISLDKSEQQKLPSQKVMTAWVTKSTEKKKLQKPARKNLMSEWLMGKSSKRKSEESELDSKRCKHE